MVPVLLHRGSVLPAPRARADESAPRVFARGRSLETDRPEFRLLRVNGRPEIRLRLRPARMCDGDALQSYVRGLSPQSRYNRFLGAASELPASELARALAANGRDTLTLLLTTAADDRETLVGEARVAFSCAERAGEFSMSIADDWRRLGVGSALLQEIERRAEADGIEWLFGDTLRTNDGMIGLAIRRGFLLEPGLEPRLVRIEKRLEDPASDLPCRKWAEVAGGAELRTA